MFLVLAPPPSAMKGSILGQCERRILQECVAVAVFVKAGCVWTRKLGVHREGLDSA